MKGNIAHAAAAALVATGMTLASVASSEAHGGRFHHWRHDAWRSASIWAPQQQKVCGWVWRRGHYVWACWWR
jgi:hypothetical protein